MRAGAAERLARLGAARPRTIVAVWLATRAAMALLVLRIIPNPLAFEAGDVNTYQVWAAQLAAGHFPAADVRWQYPPGAAAVIWLPRLLGSHYHAAFALTALAADALILAMLIRASCGRADRLGPLMWTAAVPLLGLIVFYRYDVLVSVFAVAATLAMAARPAWGGVLAGVGTLVKLWPGLTLFGMPPLRRGGARALIGAVAAALAVAAGFAVTMTGSTSFLRYQSKRGVEIESIFATPFMVMRHLGWHYSTPLRYGSYEYVGPYVGAAGYVALAATVAAFGWMLLWRIRCRRWTPAVAGDAALTATLLFILVSRVISPQYLIWVLALAAAALCRRETSQRPVAALLLAAAVLTQVEFPIAFSGLIAGHLLPALVVLARDALLVAATALSMGRLWRATTRPATGPAELAGPERARATEPATEGQAG